MTMIVIAAILQRTNREVVITNFVFTSPAEAAAKYFDEYICVCVCLSVCLSARADTSGTNRAGFTKFLCMLPMAVARSSFGVVAIRYVFPVLWITS